MRKWVSFFPKKSDLFKEKITAYTEQVENSIILNSSNFINEKKYKEYSKFNFLAGFEEVSKILDLDNNFRRLEDDWYLGFLNYNFNNISSKKDSIIYFPNSYFFQPKWLIIEENSQWKIGFLENISNKEEALEFIKNIELYKSNKTNALDKTEIKQSLSKTEYLEKFNKIKSEIYKGNLSVINLAIEFYCNNITLNPASTFININKLSPMPFSSFIKIKSKYALVFSPERYLQKNSNKIITMPMKGTAGKSNNSNENINILNKLLSSQKERGENITTVEEIKKQLSTISKEKSIVIEELCSVYDFPNVYQMVSTISAELLTNKNWFDAIKATFPMGSITGVPKERAIELIENLEPNNRSLFSGSIGYLSPKKDFDFNVVIRSLFYDEKENNLSFWAGSAITTNSVGEEEYEECLTKSAIIKKYLTNKGK